MLHYMRGASHDHVHDSTITTKAQRRGDCVPRPLQWVLGGILVGKPLYPDHKLTELRIALEKFL
jgi:hypothetical protein